MTIDLRPVLEILITFEILFPSIRSDFIKLNGATMVFLSTRSGLTRWISLDKNTTPTVDPTSTESIWYKRAVERYLMDPDSFVYSVDFDAGQQDNPVVTATRAVFVNKEGLQAPVAVVGVTYRHKDWAGKFWEITSTVRNYGVSMDSF